jgi:hypothetical protein
MAAMDPVETNSPQPAQATFGQLLRQYRLAAGTSRRALGAHQLKGQALPLEEAIALALEDPDLLKSTQKEECTA